MIIRMYDRARGPAETPSSVPGTDFRVELQAFDENRGGPQDAAATVDIRSPAALRRGLSSPNEPGIERASVAGDVGIEGKLYAALAGCANFGRAIVSALRVHPGRDAAWHRSRSRDRSCRRPASRGRLRLMGRGFGEPSQMLHGTLVPAA